jgi:ATP-dependent DNA ligase
MYELMKPKSVDTIDSFIKNDKYIYETKYDGGSSVIVKHGNDIQIFHGYNPNLQNYRYPDLIEEIKSNLKDGEYICELCVFKEGVSYFPHFLKRQLENKVKIKFVKDIYPVVAIIHDIVKNGNDDVTDNALIERKKMLKENVFDGKHIKLIELYKNPDKLLEQKDVLEGIVIKDINSYYQFGKRGNGWFKFRFNVEEKVKCTKYEDTETGIVLITEDNRRINCAGKRSEFARNKILDEGFVFVIRNLY